MRTAQYVVVAWRQIPAVVEAQDASDSVSVPLSERFHALIDAAAMQLGLAGTEAYLEAWERSEPRARTGSAREVAEAVAAELEGRFTEFTGEAFRRG
jgi:hypothetical protein